MTDWLPAPLSLARSLTHSSHTSRSTACTARLGHANVKIYACTVCPRPLCYETAPSDTPDNEMFCQREDVCGGAPMDLVKHISFVDCPGHDKLMATMLNGAAGPSIDGCCCLEVRGG